MNTIMSRIFILGACGSKAQESDDVIETESLRSGAACIQACLSQEKSGWRVRFITCFQTIPLRGRCFRLPTVRMKGTIT